MSIGTSMLPEFDQEMANTRKTLERIPEEKLDWKAHPKSNSIGWVAAHLAQLPAWAEITLKQDSFDVNPPGGEGYRTPPATSRRQVLGVFDQNVGKARTLIGNTTNDQFMQPWSLLDAGKPVLTMPRVAVVRSFVLNHIIHHRAILCVYLRLNDIPVPPLYGPSGDE
jgi:hypothetical protein